MTQDFEIWYFCVGRVAGMDIFSSFVELSFPPLLDVTKLIDVIWKSIKQNPKKKTSFLWFEIYKLIHTEFKILQSFLSRLANLINKIMLCTGLFIGFANLLGNIYLPS